MLIVKHFIEQTKCLPFSEHLTHSLTLLYWKTQKCISWRLLLEDYKKLELNWLFFDLKILFYSCHWLSDGKASDRECCRWRRPRAILPGHKWDAVIKKMLPGRLPRHSIACGQRHYWHLGVNQYATVQLRCKAVPGGGFTPGIWIPEGIPRVQPAAGGKTRCLKRHPTALGQVSYQECDPAKHRNFFFKENVIDLFTHELCISIYLTRVSITNSVQH